MTNIFVALAAGIYLGFWRAFNKPLDLWLGLFLLGTVVVLQLLDNYHRS